ncbi:MAG: DUF5009 domain-containing protein [Balneolales bacterium]
MEKTGDGVTHHTRLESLDILRGFDMFWIVGGASLIISLAGRTEWRWLELLAEQMYHPEWVGFTFYDLIFPLFMFIVGVAIPYSLISKMEKGVSRIVLLQRIFRRAVFLVLLGIIYKNNPLPATLAEVRFVSILGQIGVSYMFAAIIFLYIPSMKAKWIWIFGIMVFIAILQQFVPVPGYGTAGLSDPAGTINAWLDRTLLPGRLAYGGGTWDALGPLCTISSVSVTLMGGVAGTLLRDGNPASTRKAIILGAIGTVLVLIALILAPVYPVIKKAWTPTYSLLTGGMSFMLLALFYYFIDVLKWTGGYAGKVAFFFKVIGMNAITIYMADQLIQWNYTSGYLLGWLEVYWGGTWMVIIGAIILKWLMLYYLYKNKIFLRL